MSEKTDYVPERRKRAATDRQRIARLERRVQSLLVALAKQTGRTDNLVETINRDREDSWI